MIAIKNLRKQFQGRGARPGFLLDVQRFEIAPGEIVYFIGPNGSGKSTLLGLISGDISADGGEVIVLDLPRMASDIDLLKLPPYRRSKFLGIAPQESEFALVEELSVLENIVIAMNKSRTLPFLFPTVRLRSRSMSLASELGLDLEFRMNESVGNLSGGERQSLVALLATVGDPSLLLFDEFTASLDPQMATDVLTRTSNLIRSKRLSAFMVTHRHSEAISYADRVVVLNRGKVHTIITRGSAEFAIDYLSSLFKELYYQKLD